MDYDKLAGKLGGSTNEVDYDALAGKFGAQPVEAEPSTADSLGRQAGLTARIGIEGLSDLGSMAIQGVQKIGENLPAGNLINQAGEQFIPGYAEGKQQFSDTIANGGSRVADIIGLPKPETGAERVVNTTGRVMLPAGGTIKGAQMAMNTAKSAASQRIARFLAAAPAQQVAGAAGAGLGSSTAKELGAGETGQLIAGVAGGLGAAAGASTVNKAFNTGTLIAQPTDAIGKVSVRQRNAQEAIDSGYVLPPSTTESGVVSRTLEGISGKDKTLQLASVKNQKVTDDLAKDYLKIPRESDLTADVLNAAKQPHNEVYEAIGNLPAIKRAGVLAQGKPSMNGKQTLEALKTARYDSKLAWNYFNRSGDPEAYTKAVALDKDAAKLELQLEGIAVSAKQPELVSQLRNSRKELAKIYTVEKSINPETGNVDAKAIAKMKDKGAPIDGPLGKVAKVAKAFPDATRVPKAGYANPFTAWDATFGAVGAGVSAPALALPAARVAARYGVLSKTGQRAINANKKPTNPAATAYGLGAVEDSDD